VTAAPDTTSDADLRALAAAVADFLSAHGGEDAVRAVMDGGPYDAPAWQQMCGQLGLTGLAVSEQHGGSGSGIHTLGVVLEEAGRTLYPSPLLATAVTAWALDQGVNNAAVTRHLAALVAGNERGAIAPGRDCRSPLHVLDSHITGTAACVLDAAVADVYIVAATDDVQGEGLYLIERTSPGVAVNPRTWFDYTRPVADLSFDAVVAERIGDADQARRLRAVAATAIACEQVGGAASALEHAVSYAQIRTQFGRPIGSFQSIKHLCAEMLLAVESGRAAARRAARAIDDNDHELEVFASIAKAWCSGAYVHAAESSLQIHGGIGFTWEHVAHLHVKRAKADEFLFGDARYHRELLAELLGLTALKGDHRE
jgi:alkylation response protein AidB-like acyl-CoA dehydrogenase